MPIILWNTIASLSITRSALANFRKSAGNCSKRWAPLRNRTFHLAPVSIGETDETSRSRLADRYARKCFLRRRWKAGHVQKRHRHGERDPLRAAREGTISGACRYSRVVGAE